MAESNFWAMSAANDLPPEFRDIMLPMAQGGLSGPQLMAALDVLMKRQQAEREIEQRANELMMKYQLGRMGMQQEGTKTLLGNQLGLEQLAAGREKTAAEERWHGKNAELGLSGHQVTAGAHLEGERIKEAGAGKRLMTTQEFERGQQGRQFGHQSGIEASKEAQQTKIHQDTLAQQEELARRHEEFLRSQQSGQQQFQTGQQERKFGQESELSNQKFNQDQQLRNMPVKGETAMGKVLISPMGKNASSIADAIRRDAETGNPQAVDWMSKIRAVTANPALEGVELLKFADAYAKNPAQAEETLAKAHALKMGTQLEQPASSWLGTIGKAATAPLWILPEIGKRLPDITPSSFWSPPWGD